MPGSSPPQTCWLFALCNYICACVRSACPAATRCGSGFINTMSRMAVACLTQATTLFGWLFSQLCSALSTAFHYIQTRIGALGRYRYSDFLPNESTPISTYPITTFTIERMSSGSLLMSPRPFGNINKLLCQNFLPTIIPKEGYKLT